MKKKIFILAVIINLVSTFVLKAQDGWEYDDQGNIYTSTKHVSLGIDWHGVAPFQVTDYNSGNTMASFGFNSPIYLGEGFLGFNAYKNSSGTMIFGNGSNGSPAENRGGWISFGDGNFSYNISSSIGAGNFPISSYTKPFVINNQGKIGIGTADNALTEKLEVVGNVKATKFMLSDGTVLGSGQWTTSGSNIYYNLGSVGLGTTTPNAQLHLASDADHSFRITRANGMYGFRIYRNATEGNIYFQNTDNNNNFGTRIKFAEGGTQWQNVFINPDGGNVGIGTTMPQNKLHISEASQTEFSGTDNASPISNLILQGTASARTVGQGPSLTFSFPGNTDGSNTWAQARIMATPDNAGNTDARGRLYLQVRDLYNPGVGGSWNWRTGLMIAANGNVGVGTTSPAYKLDVFGTIRAQEVKIDLAGKVADFVFAPTYKLRPLSEVEKYVKANSHLPEIPSASEVAQNGLSLGEMQNKLLQKVEELTLYVIDQQKQIEELKKANEVLKQTMSKNQK